MQLIYLGVIRQQQIKQLVPTAGRSAKRSLAGKANTFFAAQGATVRFNQTFAARKYALDYPAFTGRTLTPGAPVEINPSPSDCFVPTPYTPEEPLALLLSQNPIEHSVHLRTNRTDPLPVACFDGLGRLLFQLEIDADGQLLDLSAYPAGMYVLYLQDGTEDFVVEPLVKL